MKIIKITTEFITLGQFLKYVGIIDNGSMAKFYLLENKVYVNGEQEHRRGRKLFEGYEIVVDQIKYIIGK